MKPKRALEESGAELLENSMILGDNAYDVVPGWMGHATVSYADHLVSAERKAARRGQPDMGAVPRDDEELLQRFVQDNP